MAETSGSYDIIVIGAGIAGASVAAELQADCRVLLIEMESQPGYHTTGRSAAIFAETYGPPPIRALTRASAAFFVDPPDGFAENPLLSPRGTLFVANETQLEMLETIFDELAREQAVERLDARQARERMPLLRESYVAGGIYDARSMDIDVHALHHGFLRRLRREGGVLLGECAVSAVQREGGQWLVSGRRGRFRAPILVNAAGAWADEIGALAGAKTIGLVPKRRTALIIAAPDGVDLDSRPMAIDLQEQFYLKPDAGRLLVSPADETPSPPCDAQPEDLDVAICVERIQNAFDVAVKRIENKWAGLRSFVPDKAPVCGFDPQAEGFFWLAGQGGYGIQSAPALARAASAMMLGKPMPADIEANGLRPEHIAPARLG